MNEEIMASEAGKPVRTLEVVTQEIRYLDTQAKRLVLGHAIEIGRRLEEAKALVPYGEWGEYIEKQLDYSQSTANNFMRIFAEYGAAQQSLFGPVAESQTLGKLSYTKALKLLAIPREERESFAEAVDAEHLSTRELDQAIRERDEARKAQEAAEAREKEAREELAETAEMLDKTMDEKAALSTVAKEYRDSAEELEKQLEEIRSRPVEVAVQEPDPALIQERAEIIAQKAIEEQAKKAKAEIDAAKKDAAAADKKTAKAKKDRAALEAKLKEAESKMEETAKQLAGAGAEEKAEADKLRAEVDSLRKQLAMSDTETTTAKVLFAAWQEAYRKLLEAVEAAPEETRDKLAAAMRAQAQRWAEG